ncbi:MAG: ribonuclease PH [Chloroflexota bacterium]
MRLARLDGRATDELRPVKITPGVQRYPEGSAMIELGETKVLCAVSVEDRVPPFLKGTGSGWITAEYAMLPRATESRTQRGQEKGRSLEIQRLIGRSLRAVADLNLLGERTFLVDCDVLQADGGTRTAAITAGYVALEYAFRTLVSRGELAASPLKGLVAATSVGVVEGTNLLDLCYEEDSHADVDFNVVMNDAGEFIEVQGTGEGRAFSRSEMDSLMSLAEKGIEQLFHIQRTAIEEIGL